MVTLRTRSPTGTRCLEYWCRKVITKSFCLPKHNKYPCLHVNLGTVRSRNHFSTRFSPQNGPNSMHLITFGPVSKATLPWQLSLAGTSCESRVGPSVTWALSLGGYPYYYLDIQIRAIGWISKSTGMDHWISGSSDLDEATELELKKELLQKELLRRVKSLVCTLCKLQLSYS